MKNRIANLQLMVVAATAGLAASSEAATFEDIQFWVGTGTNRAAMLIDWRDGKAAESLLWGYRWNGSATGLDMLQQVVSADPRLFAHVGHFEWGTSLFGLGYDLNDSGTFNVDPALSFEDSGWVADTGGADANDTRIARDAADHYSEGWNTGFWAYYLKDAASADWASANTGSEGRVLIDGAWDGYSFAPGFASATPAEPSPAQANPFAVEVVAAQGPFGVAPYDDPAAVLGMPTTDFYDPWGEAGPAERRVKLVEAPYNYRNADQTEKLLTTLGADSYLVVRFDQPVTDDPAHPYGVDLLVFGNSFYTPNGYVDDATDMNNLMLAGGSFFEPLKVSVSPGYTGAPGQDRTDWQTWDWYRYEDGPFADTTFPTHAYKWDRANSSWSSELMDFTKPVNPGLRNLLNSGNTVPVSAAEAIELYDNSGGGTGFDLAESGFAFIQYVRVEGSTGFQGGEVDAFSRVRPMVVGDSLTASPDNLTSGSLTLPFQRPGTPSQPALRVKFTALSGTARVSTAAATNSSALDQYGRVLTTGGFEVTPLLTDDPLTYAAQLYLAAGTDYPGDGRDLALFRQTPTNWDRADFEFEPATGNALVASATDSATFALVQVLPPSLDLTLTQVAPGQSKASMQVAALPGWTYTLERTADFVRWDEVASQSPLEAGRTILIDDEPADLRFYRVKMTRL